MPHPAQDKTSQTLISSVKSALFSQESKRRILCFAVTYIVIYALCYHWQLLVSHGLGPDNIHYMTVGLLPAAGAAALSLILYWKHLCITAVVPTAFIAVSWIVTGPYLSYITLVQQNTVYINNMYDIYVGLYLFAILFCLNMVTQQFLSRKIRAVVMTAAQFAAFFIIAVQWVYYALYHSCITTSGALLIFQTGPAEMMEYFHSLGIGCIALIVLFVLALLSALFFANYTQKTLPRTPVYRKILPILSLFIIFPSVCALGEEIFPYAFPIRTFIDTHDYLKRSALYTENHGDKFINLEAVQLNPPDYPNTFVVVIGESETRTLMHAFNPNHVENTPWLTSMKENSDFTLFTNAYSCVWYTVPVLERALTEANFYNNKEFNSSISILDMAKKAGYKTYWFSNQGSIGVADTPITLVAKTADVSEWTDQELKQASLDESLLQFLKQVNPEEKNFVVLHLMGSHIEYRNRYPDTFQVFNDGQVNAQADFDNTVLYTDWVLSQIFDYADKYLNLDAMIYFSDHGSDPDTGRQPDDITFKVLRIPMFCYLSEAYQNRNPIVAQTVKAHKDNFFTNDLAYEFICGVLNMQSPNYDPTYSLSSPLWKMERSDLVTRFGKVSLLEDMEF